MIIQQLVEELDRGFGLDGMARSVREETVKRTALRVGGWLSQVDTTPILFAMVLGRVGYGLVVVRMGCRLPHRPERFPSGIACAPATA